MWLYIYLVHGGKEAMCVTGVVSLKPRYYQSISVFLDYVLSIPC